MGNKIGTKYIRIFYALFIFLAIYQSIFSANYIQAASNMALALIFDPFNQDEPWDKRTKWQRIWLIVHLAAAAALLGYGISLDHLK